VEGQPNVYDREWADEPQQLGTPLNKETLLSDTVAAVLRLSQDDPTVSEAFLAIANNFSRVIVSDRSPEATDAGNPGWLWLNTSDGIYRVSICFGATDGGGYKWLYIWSARRTLKTEVFTASGSFTMPVTALGDAHIWIYGAGGSGRRASQTSKTSGNGGGGGYMTEWSGSLEPGRTYAVTVGKGGDNSDSDGKAGGSSSFDTIASAAGAEAAKSSTSGGNGGSGGGAGCHGSSSSSVAAGGTGAQFGSGGGKGGNATAGVNTSALDVPDIAKGTGEAGAATSTVTPGNASPGAHGGGGGYGGRGGNGGEFGGGGGGGYGAAGNGGNGATTNTSTSTAGDGGYGAGGGGRGYYGTAGKGGDGIVVVGYYVMEVVA
jgi:hypothetical protein